VKSEKPSPREEIVAFTAEATRSEMQAHVREIAALAPEDSRKAALRFTAMALRLPYDRVKRLFYGEARRIEAHEADQIRAYCDAAQELIEARQQYEALRREYVATAHPALARLAPRPLENVEAQEDRPQAVKRRRRG
jgi:hypothetical protein